MRKILFYSRLFNRVYFVFLVLFLVIINTSFEINHSVVKIGIFLGVLIATPLLLAWDVYFYRPNFNRIYRILPPILGFVYLFYLNPLEVFHSANTWKTQSVLFENKENPNLKLEIQERKSLNSNNSKTRTVEVNYLTNYLLKTKIYNKVHFDESQWNKLRK